MEERHENYFVQREQLLAAEQALRRFRHEREAEKSEFAAEFARLSAEHGQREVARRVRLANAVTLLECTDAELRELVLRREPAIDRIELNCMSRGQMVDRLI